MAATTTHNRQVITGLFILAALVIFVSGLFYLGGQRHAFGNTVAAQVFFDNVGGLKAGDNIFFDGVKVGLVKKIALQKTGNVLVQMEVEEPASMYIPKNSMARIGSDGLIGNKTIELYGGSLAAGTLKNGAVLQAGASSSMEQLFAGLQQNSNNLMAITTDFKNISHKIVAGEGTIGKMINDDALVNNMQQILGQLQTTVNNTNRFTSDLSNYTGQLQKPGTMTRQLLTDTVIFERLRSTTRQLDEVAKSANGVVNKLSTTAGQLQGTNSTAGLLLNDKQTSDDIKAVITNLQKSTEKLNHTLDALRYNFFLKGSFKKMEKAQDNTQKEIK